MQVQALSQTMVVVSGMGLVETCSRELCWGQEAMLILQVVVWVAVCQFEKCWDHVLLACQVLHWETEPAFLMGWMLPWVHQAVWAAPTGRTPG